LLHLPEALFKVIGVVTEPVLPIFRLPNLVIEKIQGGG
jgi:hypothetical protein